jgi:tRNA A-37 threonylcarbamoyl transferase component Bud32
MAQHACAGSRDGSVPSDYLRGSNEVSPVTGRCDRGRGAGRRGVRGADPGAADRGRGERSRGRVLSAAAELGRQRRGLRDRTRVRRARGAPARIPRLNWLDGDGSRRAELEQAVARLERGDGVELVKRRESRRHLARVPLANGRSVFAKHYLSGRRHAWRDAWKERLGFGTAAREWRALVALRAAGVPVPEPLAHVRLASGEHVVVTEWVDATPLADALAEPAQRRALLPAVGALVRALHGAGWVHRDLHRENILVAGGAPMLIDLQAARRSRGAGARCRDLGRLDYSVRRILSRADRVRLRAAALGVARPFAPAARARVKAVGRASLARARAHARSRARRSVRAGRRAQGFSAAGGSGLVSRAFDADAVRAFAQGGAGSDAFELRRYRGGAARRAWAVAHAVEASDLPCPAPVAFLEWRRFGVPVRSALVVAARGREPDCHPARRSALIEDLLARLREAGFGVRGLGPRDIGLTERGGRIEPWVVAFEKLALPARLTRC